MVKVRRSRANVRDRAHERGLLAAVTAARRDELGLRQEELADLAGVSVGFVHAIESGASTVSLGRLLSVLDVLGLHLVVERGRRPGTVSPGPDLGRLFGLTEAP